jgi:hypothetical protein
VRVPGATAKAACLPIGAVTPDSRRLIVGLVITSLFLVAVRVAGADQRPVASGGGWSRFYDVNKPGDHTRTFQAAFTTTTQAGVDANMAAAALKELGRRIDAEVAKGRSMTLCYGLITDGIAATYQARWTAQDAAALLFQLHATTDFFDGGASTERLHATLARVRAGNERPARDQTE